MDPGRRNVLTMVSDSGEKLVYSSRQRYHKSGMKRYRAILEKEKRKNHIIKIEEELSKQSGKTVNFIDYKTYLEKKCSVDDKTRRFYYMKRWRNWKFRLFSKRKKMESELYSGIETKFGKDCILYYGDWSSSHFFKGIQPTPSIGLRKKLGKKFKVNLNVQ